MSRFIRAHRLALPTLGLWLLAVTALPDSAAKGHPESADSVSAHDATERLVAGNAAFRHGYVSTEHLSESRRAELAGGQHPFAIILSCADSRVPPEEIFAQGLGDLFTIRVAGNIAEPATVASVEYAAAHLGTHLLVVLGHTQCGAVTAALADAKDTPAIRQLVATIRPAIANSPKTEVDKAVCANVHYVREEILKQSELLRGMVHDGTFEIREALYDLATGGVRFLDSPLP